MCLVCGSPEAETHFGGITCRAFAAFFRRFFHSKKSTLRCNCKTRDSRSHPCRKCRITKCLEIGMRPDKVQMCRKKHGRKMVVDSDLPSILETRIISRDFSHLSFAVSNWHEFETIQDEMNGGKIGFQNVFQMTCTVNNDIDLSWKMVHKQFPATQNLKTSDQSALLRNFMLKLWQIEPILDNIFNDEKYMNMNDEGFENLIVSFYEGAFLEGQEMSREEILRIFQPYWSFYYLKMVMPIVVLDLERAELMSIIWLLFFDNGYTNISPECQEMCRNIKKVILRELKNYQIDRNFDEMRFLDTVETLEIIDKEEKKFLEEMMICEMHHVRIHDDFKAILKENRC
ncbi:hypothetical protein L5515_009325 [Caenorhabditis briggsae]|uniref:Nuclear receptor domain-containing protein n=1 Tax=Caenorhabditis briggsae TaxID=6238 RepID=A0AAE9F9M1_CAEBR|nr:hypothetical protein L5515_009325 [Caenorhabditis briggsae]